MISVLISGTFNVLHPGHLRLLRFARTCGGHLTVAVESDRIAGAGAFVPETLRLEGVLSITWVDKAFICDQSITEAISIIQPSIVVKGKEFESRENPELAALMKYGGRLIFSSGEAIFSSLHLLRDEVLSSAATSIRLPKEYMARHSISIERLRELIGGSQGLRVCILGDLIVDEYITCEPLGMSREEPTIVVSPLHTDRFIGGAGIVAAHAAGLGATAHLFTVTGNDELHTFATEVLSRAGVNLHLLPDDSRPTSLKQRFRTSGRSLLRVNHLRQHPISQTLQAKLLGEIELLIPTVDLIVFADFNYGCLPQALVERIISLAKNARLLVAADSQSSSQMGDVSRFRGVSLLTPTEREARISTHNHDDGLVVLAEKLRHQSLAENILIKLGEDGILVHPGEKETNFGLDDRIGALNSAPKDVAGAGDSLLIASAMTLARGGNIWEAACIGSLAAAIQVGRLGNIPIRTEELLHELPKV